jgi:hypothetical protein
MTNIIFVNNSGDVRSRQLCQINEILTIYTSCSCIVFHYRIRVDDTKLIDAHDTLNDRTVLIRHRVGALASVFDFHQSVVDCFAETCTQARRIDPARARRRRSPGGESGGGEDTAGVCKE